MSLLLGHITMEGEGWGSKVLSPTLCGLSEPQFSPLYNGLIPPSCYQDHRYFLENFSLPHLPGEDEAAGPPLWEVGLRQGGARQAGGLTKV
jgi:hypothetical protein